ncbi:hypothetical protein VSDG_09638 [Cytospora chrysosperma]|uniref:Uncharacterized protein n=1 Tax=Cytospora chrysosperma TaxID=252740 RepID=A0A423VA05_CYTCH|nr:hypothetical protein VSDG_09638 [Valsa sordida]
MEERSDRISWATLKVGGEDLVEYLVGVAETRVNANAMSLVGVGIGDGICVEVEEGSSAA